MPPRHTSVSIKAFPRLQGISDVEEDFSWLWDDPNLEPDLFDDPLALNTA